MRYDVPVIFERHEAGEYDPSTGNHKPEKVTSQTHWASVTDTGADMIQMFYGSLQQKSLTVRIQGYLTGSFDRVRIWGKPYRIDMIRLLRRGQTFIVSEVQ